MQRFSKKGRKQAKNRNDMELDSNESDSDDEYNENEMNKNNNNNDNRRVRSRRGKIVSKRKKGGKKSSRLGAKNAGSQYLSQNVTIAEGSQENEMIDENEIIPSLAVEHNERVKTMFNWLVSSISQVEIKKHFKQWYEEDPDELALDLINLMVYVCIYLFLLLIYFHYVWLFAVLSDFLVCVAC